MYCRKDAEIIAADEVQRGIISLDEANVLIVQLIGVQLINCTVPREVRKALNKAVKNGELGHLKKEGLLPEAYFHKNARDTAIGMRQECERNAKKILKNIFI